VLPATPPRILRGRTRERRAISLAGAWAGEYGYDAPARSVNVPFNAILHEREGAVTGFTEEPNTFGDPAAERLLAEIDGRRAGHEVRFTKTYDGAGGVCHAVIYQGEINAESTRIDGIWSISTVRGPFYMVRASAAVEEEVEAEAEAEADPET